MEFGKLGMLGRKKNVDIIVISQLERMTDVYFRELSTASFKMRSWYVSADKLMFDFSLLDADGNDQWTKFVDLFEWAKQTGYSYDSLESSTIKKDTKSARVWTRELSGIS